MSGFVVLYHESDLGMMAAAFWLAPDITPACRAHYPDITTRGEALQQAARDFGEVRGALILAHGEAQERVRALVAASRARTARRTTMHNRGTR